MRQQHAVPSHYAILIGINCYKTKPLNGAVRDVQNAKARLEEALQPVHIRMFMATKSTDPTHCNPIEDPQLWPTKKNITSTFDEITELAAPGDFIYIHYSGHGTRQEPDIRSYNQSSGDLALVLLTGDEKNPETYLFGRSLAYRLNAMVEKGLVVTVVLDCCFSASIYRNVHDPSVRLLPYDLEIGSQSKEDTPLQLGGFEYRDVSMLPNWLIDQNKYAILVACGPHEKAVEAKFDDGQKHGALSYVLLGILKESNRFGQSIGDISEYIRAEFRKRLLHRYQSPVRYGNSSQAFFGIPNLETPAIVYMVIKKADNSLELQAGQAHGFTDGDTFTLYPFGRIDPNVQDGLLVAKVTRAAAFTSELEPSDKQSIRDQTIWKAKPLTQLLLRKFPIWLESSLPYYDKMLAALKERFLNADMNTDVYALRAVLDNHRNLEIQDGSSRKIENLPVISESQTNITRISDVLEHLVRFRLVMDLGNEALTNDFQKSFDIHIYSNGTFFGPQDSIELNDGTTVELVVENRGVSNLYVSIFNLGPYWQVENIYRATYTVVAPKNDTSYSQGILKKRIKMQIPVSMKEEGHHSCQDILKVFVTSHPTSFDSLELPKLGKPARDSVVQRASQDSVDENLEHWAALNFLISITVPTDTVS
ncbi:hypothetical protein NPX13_g2820 [Xylaria arbuscula]|uniref:Peptidase C14 caspase domain-containing protein n=1 Tax=Xylaria arbuscula TaxID=114810 RepID=A0A9W8NJD2_9PEZI|nr:hypothetical protein NPX13_g2820 [Xylaria arbuscula]